MTYSITRIGLAAILLTLAGCQSAEERQANELREFLRGQVLEIEPLNEKIVEGKKALYEVVKQGGREADVRRALKDYEETRDKLPKQLAELRRKIEEYPDLELAALSGEIQRTIRSREDTVKWVAREQKEAQSWQKFFSLTEANKERARESLRMKTYPIPRRDK